MKSKFLPFAVLSATLMLVVGCQKEPETTVKTGNFKVEKLFTTKEGCTVSRFYDDRTVHFTDCRGETNYEQSCGKNCSETVNIAGARK